jgi:hypothetical protein
MTSVFGAAAARKPLMDGELPPGSTISQGLEIDPKYSVPFIPPCTRFEGGFVCKGNSGLTRVGKGVYAKEELTLNDCLLLQIIEDDLFVDGNLSLMNCPALAKIGDGLTVKGTVNLAGCSKAIQLPSHGEVAGDLILPTGFDTSRISPTLKSGEVLIAS